MSTAPRHVGRPQRPARSAPSPRPKLRVIPGGGQGAASSSTANASARRSSVIFVSVAVAAIAALVFSLVLLNIIMAQSSFRLNDLNARVAEEQLRYRRMRFEVAKAESPGRIAAAAQSIGLVPPERQEYLVGRPTFKSALPSIADASGEHEAMKSVLDSGP